MQMLRTFSRESFEFGLASWRWLGIDGKTPRFTTCFGDVFLESLEGWWFLDTVEGTLELRWPTAVDMYAELETPDGQATFLLADLVQEATHRGVPLGPGEVFTFNPHPATGGDLTVDTVVPARFELVTHWAGQLHEQARRTAPQPLMPERGHVSPADGVDAAWDSAWQAGPEYATAGAHQVPAGGRHLSAQPAPGGATGGYARDLYADAYTDPNPTAASPYAADGYGAGTQEPTGYGTDARPADAYPAHAYPGHAHPAREYPAREYPAHEYPAHEYQAETYGAGEYTETSSAETYRTEAYGTGAYPTASATPPGTGAYPVAPAVPSGTYATVATPARYDAPTTPSTGAETGSLPAWDDLWRRR